MPSDDDMTAANAILDALASERVRAWRRYARMVLLFAMVLGLAIGAAIDVLVASVLRLWWYVPPGALLTVGLFVLVSRLAPKVDARREEWRRLEEEWS